MPISNVFGLPQSSPMCPAAALKLKRFRVTSFKLEDCNQQPTTLKTISDSDWINAAYSNEMFQFYTSLLFNCMILVTGIIWTFHTTPTTTSKPIFYLWLHTVHEGYTMYCNGTERWHCPMSQLD